MRSGLSKERHRQGRWLPWHFRGEHALLDAIAQAIASGGEDRSEVAEVGWDR
jgi:hypothetical protein